MGKRELLIAVIFGAVGLVAYQLTAAPPKPGERGFSLTQLFSGLRKEIRSNSVSAKETLTGALPVPAGITEVRVTVGRGTQVTVTGEPRDDIAYELPVESSGPDEATASTYAKKTQLKTDNLGESLSLTIKFPDEGRQTASLALKVPAGLAVRVENASHGTVTGVASVMLSNVSGEMTISDVGGAITGAHRQGELTISRVGSISLSLNSSRAKFKGVARGITITGRAGECEIADSHGRVELTVVNVETTVIGQDGPVSVGGDGGVVRLKNPSRETRVDMRRTEIEVSLDAAVPLTLLTTDETLTLTLDGPPAIELDSIASEGGHVQASDFSLQPEASDRSSRLAHVFGPKGARVVLRNARADIVIGKRK